MAKRRNLVAIVGIACLLLALFATHFINPTSKVVHASGGGPITTINGLHTLSTIGSTQYILDAKGKTTSVDANPYGVAIAPPGITSGTLQSGDILVTNFGATGTGTTLVRFPQKTGPGQIFSHGIPATKGPAALAFSTSGHPWIANFATNTVQILDTSGRLIANITSPLFNKPWGQAFNAGTPNPKDGSFEAFFSTNAANGTIDRIDVVPVKQGFVFKVFQIGQLSWKSTHAVPVVAPQGMVWVPNWSWNGQMYPDVLLVVDAARNRIAAYPYSSTRNTTSTPSTDQGITVFQGAPLNTPAGLTLNPINGDLLAVNQLDNNIVELSSSGQIVGTSVLDNAPVNPRTGAGSALFGLVATTDAGGNLAVYFTDDLTNTLNGLSV